MTTETWKLECLSWLRNIDCGFLDLYFWRWGACEQWFGHMAEGRGCVESVVRAGSSESPTLHRYQNRSSAFSSLEADAKYRGHMSDLTEHKALCWG